MHLGTFWCYQRHCLLECLVCGWFLLCLLCTVSQAQISLDGSLGPPGALAGPAYVIPPEVGQIRGNNLFHSFRQFNLNTGESATFTGPASVSNIVFRVTGGDASSIDGRLRSEIAGATLYRLNPQGMLFGPNASLEVQGSLYLSTADGLHFTDGTVFYADLGLPSLLTVASPITFAFLGPIRYRLPCKAASSVCPQAPSCR